MTEGNGVVGFTFYHLTADASLRQINPGRGLQLFFSRLISSIRACEMHMDRLECSYKDICPCIYVVFLIITENEFYEADCVLSIEEPTAATNNTGRLGPLPPLPSEVSSNKQTFNMHG